jgi:hypothetical protein
MSAPDLNAEDAAALARLREHLRRLGDPDPRVTVDRTPAGWCCVASATVRDGLRSGTLAVTAWHETAGGAICEAGRLCGVAL